MCQLLAMSCNSSAAISFSFTGFAERGGRTDHHADGWGIGFYEATGCRTFHDDAPACSSALAAFVKSYPIKARIVLAHIRKATQGETGLSNCHPFQREWFGRKWLFAHNGDVRQWRPALHGAARPVGTTDSEHAFCWLMQRLRDQFDASPSEPTWSELAPALAQWAGECAQHGNFNVTISDGRALFVHCSSHLFVLQRQFPFPVAQLTDCDVSVDLSALNHRDDQLAIIATAPLTHEASWQRLRAGESRLYENGQCVWSHHNPHTRTFPAADAALARSA
jgi:predicted glutamine amidotransferase